MLYEVRFHGAGNPPGITWVRANSPAHASTLARRQLPPGTHFGVVFGGGTNEYAGQVAFA